MATQDADGWDYDLWSAEFARFIAEQVRWRRKARGWSARDLSDQCLAAGFDIPRSTIADLENGRRRSVNVVELLALARVLGVSPVDLIYPLELGSLYKVSRWEWLPCLEARRWWSGQSYGRPVNRNGEPIKAETPAPEEANRDVNLELVRAALADAIAPLVAHIEGLTQALSEKEYALAETRRALDDLLASPPPPSVPSLAARGTSGGPY